LQTILLVEDDPDCALLMEASLLGSRAPDTDEPLEHRVLHVESWAAARLALATHDCVACLLDLGLPDIELPKLLDEVSRLAARLPVLILTGRVDRAIATEAIQRGAQDYLLKGDVRGELLRRAVRYAMARQHSSQALGRAQQRQVEARDELLSHVSHELRTPLTAIHQFTTLLLDEIPGAVNDEQKTYLDIMLRNTLQLSDMVDDLMDVARAECGKLGLAPLRVDLPDLASDVVRSLDASARERGVRLLLAAKAGLAAACADARRVRQVLSNLVSNALKFTPAGGTIEVALAPSGDGATSITVTDTGCGIPPSAVPHVFDRLCQGDPSGHESRSGLGLGLYICRQLVEQMGGRIGVSSAPGRGSRFWLTLPAYSARACVAPLVARWRTLAGAGEADAAFWLVRVSAAACPVGQGPDPGRARDAGAPMPLPDGWMDAAHARLARLVASDRGVALPRELDRERRALACVVLTDTAGGGIADLCRRIESELAAVGADRCRPKVSARAERMSEGGRDAGVLAAELEERLQKHSVPLE
jgi:signal transduction histidine kinase